MNITELINSPLASVAAMGAVGTLIFSLKEIPVKGFQILKNKTVSRFIFTATIPDYDDLFQVVEKWVFEKYNKEYREVHASLVDSTTPTIEGQKRHSITFKSAPNIFSIKYNGKRIFIEKKRTSIEHAQDLRSLFAHEYIIRGFRAKEQVFSLLNEARDYYFKDVPDNAINIRTHDANGYFDIPNLISVKPIDKVIINEELKQKVLEDLDFFINNKKWYIENSIPYKHNYGIYGPPGTGKTTLCLAIASYMKSDVYILNMNVLRDDSDLQRIFTHLPAGCMLLIEDIDSSFTQRNSNCKVSFSALLNCMDGALYKEGVVICFTTNHLDRLDPALLRAGRCDMLFEVPYPGEKEISAFLSQFYGVELQVDELALSIPMAEIQEICINNKDNYSNAITSIVNRTERKMKAV